MGDGDPKSAVMTCANVGCQVSQNGRCLEGLELDACPHYGRPPQPAGDEPSGTGEAPGAGLRLRGANTLTPAEAAAVLRAGEARVLGIVGPSDSGKTSLIASLYDMFQAGPLAGVEFARSRSLHAFEMACHEARAVSRRTEPHTERTPHGDVRFYHLDVGGGPAGDLLALLLGDRAGEEYRSAADNASVVNTFPELSRADSLTLLVDGDRLCDTGRRHNVASDAIMILQALLERGILHRRLRVGLVLTKLDAVMRSAERQRAEADFVALHTKVKHLFGPSVAIVTPFQIAASPKTDVLRRGAGVAELLAFWVQRAEPPLEAQSPLQPAYARAFARLRPTDEAIAQS